MGDIYIIHFHTRDGGGDCGMVVSRAPTPKLELLCFARSSGQEEYDDDDVMMVVIIIIWFFCC